MRTVLAHAEAEREFDRLVVLDRDTRFDLGEHYRRLEWLREAPPVQMPRAVHVTDGIALYQLYGARVQMFDARTARAVVLLLLVKIGSEHAQREARERTIGRLENHDDDGRENRGHESE